MTTVARRSVRSTASIIVIVGLFAVANSISAIFFVEALTTLTDWAKGIAWLSICIGTGVLAARNGSSTRRAAGRGLVMGSLVLALYFVVGQLLSLLGVAGLYKWAAATSGGAWEGPSLAAAVSQIISPAALLAFLVAVLVAGLFGAGLAALAHKTYRWVEQFDIRISRRPQTSLP